MSKKEAIAYFALLLSISIFLVLGSKYNATHDFGPGVEWCAVGYEPLGIYITYDCTGISK